MMPQKDFRRQGVSVTSRTLESAMRNDIEPLRSSFKSTADAGEYESAGDVETRDWCITIESAAFCTARVTRLGVVKFQGCSWSSYVATYETYLSGIPHILGPSAGLKPLFERMGLPGRPLSA